MGVDITVLGAIEVRVVHETSTESRVLGRRRLRAVLARLVIARGHLLSVDRLTDDLWSGAPSPSALGALQVHISQLRRLLEPDRRARDRSAVLQSEHGGYALQLPDSAVDAWRFEELITGPTDQARTSRVLHDALSLWRGAAFGEFTHEPWALVEAARLEDLRSGTRERLAGALLTDGRFVDATRTADALTLDHPLREEPWRLLATALYASGRQADALAALRRARTHLVEELGLDPSPALRALERDILTHTVDLPRASVRVARSGSPTVDAPDAPPSPEFVGRHQQLLALGAAAEQAQVQRAAVLALIVAEPGAGKSTLLERFGTDIAKRGWNVVRARCLEAGEAPPGWPWMELTEALSAGVELPDGVDQWSRNSAADGALDAAYGRFMIRRGLAELVTAAARQQPLVVLIDDLHRADALTLDLLNAVADDVDSAPVLLVGTSRFVTPGIDVADRVAALQERSPLRITLPGFDLDEAAKVVHAIVGNQTDPDTIQSLTERTGGNAYYLVESARLLRTEGSVVALSRVPDGVRDVLRRRLRLLPPLTVEVLQLAAVVGRDIDLEVLQRAAALTRPTDTSSSAPPLSGHDVEDALESARRAGLLVEHRAGTLRFVHIVVCETLYDDVPTLRRARWHAGIAQVLADLRSNDIVARANHLARSGTSVGARAAIDTAAAAADQAMTRYAPERAVELYDQALHALDRLAPEKAIADTSLLAEQVELLCRRSRAELAAGAGEAALRTRETAVDAAERSRDDQLLVQALTAWDLPTPWTTRPYGSFDRHLVGLIERSLRIPDLTPQERCKLSCILVRETAGADQPRATEAAIAAEHIARHAEDPVLLGLALHARGAVLLHDSDLVARLALAEELCRIGEQAGLGLFAFIGHEYVVQYAVAHAEVSILDTHLERMEALVRTYQWPQAEAVVTMHRGVLAHITGDLSTADRTYRRGIELLRSNGGLDVGWIGAISLFSVAVSAGRAADLAPALDGLRPFPPATVDLVAVVLTAADRRDEAMEARQDAPSIPRDFFRSLRLTGRALAIVELRAVSEAQFVYDQLLPFTGQLGGGVTGAFAFFPVDALLGDLAALLDQRKAARLHYDQAAAVINRCGSPVWMRALMDKRLKLSGRRIIAS